MARISRIAFVLLAFVSVAAPALAVGPTDGGASSKPADPDYTSAVKAIKAGQFPEAVRLLEGVIQRDTSSADSYNWLGYAVRRKGDPAAAIPIYQKALGLDPKHRGAHEYIGEAYLLLDNLPKAKEHLARLDSLCFLPCSEYSDLKRAVQAYESSGGKVKPTGQ